MIRLEKLLTWSNSITYDGAHLINDYVMHVSFHSTVDDEQQQAVAYERMKWWIYSVMQDAVLIHQDDPMLLGYQETRQRVLALPADPVDHLVIVMLYYKLNAIMESRLIIDEIKLSSAQGDEVWYRFGDKDEQYHIETHWWLNPGPLWVDRDSSSQVHNIISLERDPTWNDLGLGWPQEELDTPDGNQVVYADFGKNANK